MQHGVLAGIAFFLAVFLAAQGSLAAGAGVKVTYDKQRDRLSIQAHKVSLTQVLGRVAAETGMNIRTHPDVEKTVTLQLPPQPLERALKQLVRGYLRQRPDSLFPTTDHWTVGPRAVATCPPPGIVMSCPKHARCRIRGYNSNPVPIALVRAPEAGAGVAG